jgi:hypothetical protein
MSAPACRTRLDRDCEVIRTRERCGWLSDPSVTRRPCAVYARANKTNLLPEPASLVRHAAQAVVGSARARGGRRAHADRVRPSACSFCIGPSTARTRLSSARGSASSNPCRGGGMCELLHTGDVFGRAALSGVPAKRSLSRGTGSSNPSPSSGESANFRSLARCPTDCLSPSGPIVEEPSTLAADHIVPLADAPAGSLKAPPWVDLSRPVLVT